MQRNLVCTRSQKLLSAELGFKLFAFKASVLFPGTYFGNRQAKDQEHR